MSNEVIEALELLEKERGIAKEYMVDQICKAIQTACKNSYGNENAIVRLNEESGEFEVALQKTVVEDEDFVDPDHEILLEKARELAPGCAVGDTVNVEMHTKEFGRIAASQARGVIRQGIRARERGMMLEEFQSKVQELVTASVERVDPRNGALTLRIGKSEAVLPRSEMIGEENYQAGDLIKVLVVDVHEGEKGPHAVLSRTHPDFVKRLFEKEVSEIYDGTVEIMGVAREAGSRTKLAVRSREENVDAVGACIGARGARVNAIVEELGGEKIDIAEYSDDPAVYIEHALSPASVVKVALQEDGSHACQVTVPDTQLSLAIGNKGQNARLAARLTGWKIDIKAENEAE